MKLRFSKSPLEIEARLSKMSFAIVGVIRNVLWQKDKDKVNLIRSICVYHIGCDTLGNYYGVIYGCRGFLNYPNRNRL